MSSVLARIDKDLYEKLKRFAFEKHRSFRCVKIELDEAVKQYLENNKKEE